ncbi:MAG: signal peptide peptidase SppA [Alphaproteobacteria bacterium]
MDQETATTIEAVIDREKQRKRAKRWRRISVLLILGIAIGALSQFASLPFGPHIARYEVSGFIAADPQRDELLKDIAEDDMAEALMVVIDSPGGTIVGSEDLFNALRLVAEKKPVVAVMGTMAASGGYITALGADHIIARRNTLTGSIGVIFQAPQLTGLLDKIGVEVETYRSGELKALPSGFEETPEAAKIHMEELIADGFEWFHTLVIERRSLTTDQAALIADGRVFSGKQALETGLIDALGNEQAAQEWLHKNHGIAADREVVNVMLPPVGSPFGVAGAYLGPLGRMAGLADASKTIESKGLFVDGVMALWHPFH